MAVDPIGSYPDHDHAPPSSRSERTPEGGSAMGIIWEELVGGIPDPPPLVRVTLRRPEQEP